MTLMSPAFQGDSVPIESPRKPNFINYKIASHQENPILLTIKLQLKDQTKGQNIEIYSQ